MLLCSVWTDSWADDERYECDVGWQAFQAGCYKLTSEKMDWDGAQKTCQKMEASLVSIHTLPELEFIINNLKRGEGNRKTDGAAENSFSKEEYNYCKGYKRVLNSEIVSCFGFSECHHV